MGNSTRQRRAGVILILGLILSISSGMPVSAQPGPLSFALTAEHDIGFDCPVTSALDPDGTTVWVLMDDCGGASYTLRAFSLENGAPLNDADHAFAGALTVLEPGMASSVDTWLAVLPDGSFSIYYPGEDYIPRHLTLAPDGTAVTGDTFGQLAASLTEYPEYSSYSADHTRAVVTGPDGFHVIDLASNTELVAIDAPWAYDGAFAAFSYDAQQLYVMRGATADPNDPAAILTIYNVSGGDLVSSIDLSGYLVWPGPDGHTLAISLSDDSLALYDVAAQTTGPAVPIYEPPHTVTTCLNDGRDVSDIGFQTRGKLDITDLKWLPDGSGFVTVNTYWGDGAGGDAGVCIFDYSRLRQYVVGG